MKINSENDFISLQILIEFKVLEEITRTSIHMPRLYIIFESGANNYWNMTKSNLDFRFPRVSCKLVYNQI